MHSLGLKFIRFRDLTCPPWSHTPWSIGFTHIPRKRTVPAWDQVSLPCGRTSTLWGCRCPALTCSGCTGLPRSVGSTVPLRCQLPFLRLWAPQPPLCLRPWFVSNLALGVLPSSISAPRFSSTEYNSEAFSEYKCKHALSLGRLDISMMYGSSVPCKLFGAGIKTVALQLPNVELLSVSEPQSLIKK